jgi:hypothetical protein
MKKPYCKPLTVSSAHINGGLPTVLAIGAIAAAVGATAAAVGVVVSQAAAGHNHSIHIDKTTPNFIVL